jgi:hypothetical protein
MSISLELSSSSDCYCVWELDYAKEISDARKKSNNAGNVPAQQRNIAEKATDIICKQCKKTIFRGSVEKLVL